MREGDSCISKIWHMLWLLVQFVTAYELLTNEHIVLPEVRRPGQIGLSCFALGHFSSAAAYWYGASLSTV